MAGRSILDRDLVSRLGGARRQGFHVADSSDLRSADRAATCRVVTARGLEARWLDIRSRRSGKEVSSWGIAIVAFRLHGTPGSRRSLESLRGSESRSRDAEAAPMSSAARSQITPAA